MRSGARGKPSSKVWSQRHFGGKHRNAGWHRNRGPSQWVRRRSRIVVRGAVLRIFSCCGAGHRTQSQLKQVRRVKPSGRGLRPKHDSGPWPPAVGVSLRRDQKGEFLEVDDSQPCPAIAHCTLAHDRVHGRCRDPGHVGGEIAKGGGRWQPCCREDQLKAGAALGRDGHSKWAGDMAQFETT